MSDDRKNRDDHQLDLLAELARPAARLAQEARSPSEAPSPHPQRSEAATGRELKAEGMAQALAPWTLQDWKETFREKAIERARSGIPFTSEDIILEIGLPREQRMNANNAVGAMMNGLATRGVIGKTGRRRQSIRPSSHSAEILEWVGAGVLA